MFNYKGKLIYNNKKHIDFSSKHIHVLKEFEPNEHFIIENTLINDSYEVDGNGFYYLKNNKALVVNKDNWFVLDLHTRKKQRVDKEDYFRNLYQMMEH